MRNKNKAIGIIGDMGPQASAKLLEVLIGMCSKDFGAKSDNDFPEIILNSVAVPDFISNEDDIKTVLQILKKRVLLLENFNPLCFGIVCNTAHLMLADLQKDTSVPFVSIIDEVVRKVKNEGINRVGLLSTPVTVKTGLYQRKCTEEKIELITPTKRQQEMVEKVIRNVLAGKIENSDKKRLAKIAESLIDRGAQGIILGCTELPLIFPKEFLAPFFDSIEILTSALLQKFYDKKGVNKYATN